MVETGNSETHRTDVNYIKLASDSDPVGNQVVENDENDIESETSELNLS